MRITYEHEQNEYLMARACNSKEKGLLDRAYNAIYNEIEKNGIDNKFGLVSVSESILSASTYYHISQSICRLEDKIIVDCGCAEGLQQVFFSNAKKYIGIDIQNNFFKICDNAEFIHGDIVDVLPTLKLDNAIGISVLCGMCFMDVNAAMKKYFKDLIII